MLLSQKTSDLKRRMREALQGGGTKAIESQKSKGKLTARERILALLDAKSFHEYDMFV
ncbi:MAG TPA: methylmalonyl-CoA carboxyltransferase, partial [Bacteroidales bacterium]|nr:methylmalonyl-CoA carboxyltransferase [Bacteroidales bacterium]